ncbi:hypothetical protein A2526_00165 [candidate division WOR-1 bacterium RIFOXYD2_FULL_36_8]|uniref:Uncharacterized protein n=1 Tax=candidate division WOR-1 bacterium RIFOXYB2_FULL_36_35 TaxID=1802578 RepID=A0A1F4RXU8_UNCSA|nr:MAG: hypothetical protein A2230_03335 [candidate division WOR-1 bacterium RIFOXYA2_FULL_36_21]OGC12979.1 MAG: hypothetical protein A2290_04935 [candidate division WOR-1 bacterium RIFOXYB2_FULL_36_35]OGC15193.1 MAG: hypothetical protein A2282_07535 [candidate division WOR-1 bacterium RIFOXYA12_FULL_36_13]OGC40055.1 MAG: hypothetical protein A2526_00165 [candidate division WOR-1 bacterium RIFOXYD2_FULL_36_8]
MPNTCKVCGTVPVRDPIDYPDVLRKFIRLAKQKVQANEFIVKEEKTIGTLDLPFDQLPEDILEDGSIAYTFQCKQCGSIFHLSCDMYHGRGSWLKQGLVLSRSDYGYAYCQFDGILFWDDTMAPIYTNADGQCYAGEKITIQQDNADLKAENWQGYNITGDENYQNYRLFFGKGQNPNDSIVVLLRDSILEWIFHLKTGGEIIDAQLDEKNITATSEKNQKKQQLIIPIQNPEKFAFLTS